MKDLGYETHNSMSLLGSLFLFTMLYFMRVMLFYPVVKLFVKITKIGEQYFNELRDTLFYGEIIVISIEAYIELLIAGYVNYRYQLDSTGGEKFAVWVSYYCLFMCLVIMPFFSIYILTREMDSFHDEQFQIRYGAFWEGVR